MTVNSNLWYVKLTCKPFLIKGMIKDRGSGVND